MQIRGRMTAGKEGWGGNAAVHQVGSFHGTSHSANSATAAVGGGGHRLPSYSYVRGRFIAEQEERERPEGGTTLGRSERRSGSGRFRRSRADSADFDGLFNGPASD